MIMSGGRPMGGGVKGETARGKRTCHNWDGDGGGPSQVT